jgi:hypothetical protein
MIHVLAAVARNIKNATELGCREFLKFKVEK